MYGTITLASTGGPEVLPIFQQYLSGTHNPGRLNGNWIIAPEGLSSSEVYLPQRDKHVTVWSEDPGNAFWANYLKQQELKKDTQRSKLQQMAGELPSHIDTAVLNTDGEHGSISLVVRPQETPFNVSVVISQRSVQLLWSRECMIEKLRMHDPRQYSFYRFPTIKSTMFINTLAVCSKWWKWTQTFGNDTLKCCNALEVLLTRDR